MKRRNFFHSLALLAGAASISPQIFIPKFEPVIWKSTTPLDIAVEWNAYKFQLINGTWICIEQGKHLSSIFNNKL